ncbi:MAG: hypothetical protein OES46_07115 [Gammaproteobacteria bacterium]|jgi:hypothetical protein|nr:hypothetical protein [Gammaproteobacteria bacterium]
MKNANLAASLVREISTLMAKCEAIGDAHPEMQDVVAMVDIGDIYSLREDTRGADTAARRPRPYASDLDIAVI